MSELDTLHQNGNKGKGGELKALPESEKQMILYRICKNARKMKTNVAAIAY
jgi:hypothetical protein